MVAVDVAHDKLEAALRLGATPRWRGTGGAEETAERVRAITGGGVDWAFEATGRTEAGRAAFLSTRARGAAVLIGIPGADDGLRAPRADDPAAASAACSARSTARRARIATSPR